MAPNPAPNPAPKSDGPEWVPMYLVTLLIVAFLLMIGAAGHADDDAPRQPAPTPSPGLTPGPRLGLSIPEAIAPSAAPSSGPPAPRTSRPPVGAPAPTLPDGGTRVLTPDRLLVAYYGTAGTGSLGVLGEGSPAQVVPRLKAAAAPFARRGRDVQPVFELIVTVAHASPGRSGTYSSDISADKVRSYIRAAHRYGALLVLDLQPGTADFLTVAKRWEWALRDPWVGLALDPEWRMSRGGVPGKRIGSVGAAEINQVSAWLDTLTAQAGLPQKVFLLHQFRRDMIRRVGAVRPRAHLATVQHVDGYGTPHAKLATFRHVIRPAQFALGFKLFYDEDVRRMNARQVLAIRPRVSYVSFQ